MAADRLNLVFLVADTWSTHFLGCYGNPWIRTPAIDALARRSVLFEDVYAENLPTIPSRRSLYTGRRTFPSMLVKDSDDPLNFWRGWHRLYDEDATMSESLRDAGYRTALITDVYHTFRPGRDFHRGFDCWRFIRGQEGDPYATGPRKGIETPVDQLRQYLTNRQFWRTEEDWCVSEVMNQAVEWLDSNAGDDGPFYLHVETFSPHEFWDPPEDYYRLYMKGDYNGPRILFVPQTTEEMSAVEQEHVKALYAGFVTFVDNRIGRLLDKIDSLGLRDSTMVVFSADHGTMQGEQGHFGKGEGLLRTQVTHVPLLVSKPRAGWAGRRVRGFADHTDIMPTLLDILGVKAPARVTGRSLAPLIESGQPSPREMVVTGWTDHAAIRTPEWLYMGRWNAGAAYEELYDLKRDPLELNSVNHVYPELIDDFRRRLRRYVEDGWDITRGGFQTKLT